MHLDMVSVKNKTIKRESYMKLQYVVVRNAFESDWLHFPD